MPWRPQNSQTFTDPTQFSQTVKALKSLSHFPQTFKDRVNPDAWVGGWGRGGGGGGGWTDRLSSWLFKMMRVRKTKLQHGNQTDCQEGMQRKDCQQVKTESVCVGWGGGVGRVIAQLERSQRTVMRLMRQTNPPSASEDRYCVCVCVCGWVGVGGNSPVRKEPQNCDETDKPTVSQWRQILCVCVCAWGGGE